MFLFCETGAAWYYTFMDFPLEVYLCLLQRGDHQIGFQELAAPMLALATWPSLFQRCMWSAFLDNQGALHATINASSKSAEQNIAVGKVWLALAAADVRFHALRVESKSNVADGPTRDDYAWVVRLKAKYVPPVLPGWLYQVWDLST